MIKKVLVATLTTISFIPVLISAAPSKKIIHMGPGPVIALEDKELQTPLNKMRKYLETHPISHADRQAIINTLHAKIKDADGKTRMTGINLSSTASKIVTLAKPGFDHLYQKYFPKKKMLGSDVAYQTYQEKAEQYVDSIDNVLEENIPVLKR